MTGAFLPPQEGSEHVDRLLDYLLRPSCGAQPKMKELATLAEL